MHLAEVNDGLRGDVVLCESPVVLQRLAGKGEALEARRDAFRVLSVVLKNEKAILSMFSFGLRRGCLKLNTTNGQKLKTRERP